MNPRGVVENYAVPRQAQLAEHWLRRETLGRQTVSSMKMRAASRRLLLTFAVASTVACRGNGPTAPTAPADQFDQLWATFDREYSYFVLKGIDWNALRAEYRPRAVAAATQDEFVAVIREMLGELRDIHVQLIAPSGATLPTYVPTTVRNFDQPLWQQVVTAGGWVQVKLNLGYATLRGIPYVAIGSWNTSQFSATDLDQVLERFRTARALIVDVRANPGGNDQLALAFAARFAARTAVTEYIQFRSGAAHTDFGAEVVRTVSPGGPWQFTNPVLVLSGRGVYSSNESFIAAMREQSHITIVGDTTGGGTANPGTHDLGLGWKYTVSRWIARTADRQPIEGRGIPPNVHVAWDAAIRAQGRDPVIEAALTMLGAPPP